MLGYVTTHFYKLVCCHAALSCVHMPIIFPIDRNHLERVLISDVNFRDLILATTLPP